MQDDNPWFTISFCIFFICIGLAILFARGITNLFKTIGQTFDAFGSMLMDAGNFLLMTGKLIVVSSFTIGVSLAFAYALFKFIGLMENSTKFMDTFNEKSTALMVELRGEHRRFERIMTGRMECLEEVLDNALKPPTATPEAAKPVPTEVAANETNDSEKTNEEGNEDSEEADNESVQYAKAAGSDL